MLGSQGVTQGLEAWAVHKQIPSTGNRHAALTTDMVKAALAGVEPSARPGLHGTASPNPEEGTLFRRQSRLPASPRWVCLAKQDVCSKVCAIDGTQHEELPARTFGQKHVMRWPTANPQSLKEGFVNLVRACPSECWKA